VQGRCIGTLLLRGGAPVDLGPEERDAAETLAASAAAYVLNCRALDDAVTLAAQLQQALDSRVVIEQAKGKLSAQLGVEPARAFEALRRHSRNGGLRLADVAAAVVEDRLRLAPPGERAEV
jgi:AmiR/NasT family two-component response regulator